MGIRLRDPGWVLTIVVGALAIAAALASLGLRLRTPTEDAVILTETWAWTSNGVRVEPVAPRSPFASGDTVVAMDGRPLEAWVTGAISPLGGNPNPALGDRVTFDVVRDGVPRRLDVPRLPFPVERVASLPLGVGLFAGLVLALATLLVLRRSRSTALRLLFVAAAAHTADITAWEIGLQPTDFGADVPFVALFALAGVFNLVFWSAIVHLLLVYPTRSHVLGRRPSIVPLIYGSPFAAFAVLAIAARLAGGTTLDWIDRLASCLGLVASAMIVVLLAATWSAWSRSDAATRRSLRWVALSLVCAAFVTLVTLTLPIVLLGAPLLRRNLVDLVALPVPVTLIVAVVRDRVFQVALLSRSRERIVAAREDERRRLRRDLHDGLAPSLAAVGLKLDQARAAVRTDPPAAEAAIEEARADIRSVIADIRRMSRELRPPALDSLGLVGAIREQAEALGSRAGGAPEIVVESDDRLPPLPAAVEVAAYRIAVEAMMNVVRHAAARSCQVRMGLGADGLEIEVTDDGEGLRATPAGVGLRSMRERASEVGGDVTVSTGPAHGTRVHARLPVDLSGLGAPEAARP